MNINKDRTIAILNDILSHISEKKMSAMKDSNHDMFDAYEHMFHFIVDIYCEKVAEWKRNHPISMLIMNIRHKRRLNRFKKMTAEIRGRWV